MGSEMDLQRLLKSMEPVLHDRPYVYCTLPDTRVTELPFEPLFAFTEAEGLSLVIPQEKANRHGLAYESAWAWISLSVYSSLHAIGFLAAITQRMAQDGISVNPVSAYHHDHLLVPWESRERAMAALHALSAAKEQSARG